MNYLSLFSGIGGLDLGLDRAGMTCVGQVEKDPWCRRVLAKHWKVPRHDDVYTAVEWWRGGPRPAVHAVVGGFPCQPVSYSGLGLAQDDERWLWPAMADAIDALRPGWVIGENVPGLLRRGLADVLRDLGGLGYRARAGVVSACAVGAPHPRERVFVVAHADGVRCGPRGADVAGVRPPAGVRPGAEPDRGGWRPTEPRMARMVNGLPGGVDRRRGLGNAVVPQVAEHVGRLIMAAAA